VQSHDALLFLEYNGRSPHGAVRQRRARPAAGGCLCPIRHANTSVRRLNVRAHRGRITPPRSGVTRGTLRPEGKREKPSSRAGDCDQPHRGRLRGGHRC
jgi:hypothetical protein